MIQFRLDEGTQTCLEDERTDESESSDSLEEAGVAQVGVGEQPSV